MEYFDDYYGKAKELLKTSRLEAYQLLLKCEKVDPNDLGVNNYLFYLEMMFGDYDKAIKRLDILFGSGNDNYLRNLNIYLVLLNKIGDLPEKYQEYVANLTLDDIRISNPYLVKRIENENRVRNLIMINKCYNSLKVLNETIRAKQYVSLSDNIIKSLLNKAIIKSDIDNKLLVNFIKKKDYKQAIAILEKAKKKEGLNRSREYCLKLLYVLDIGAVPNVKDPNVTYIDFTDYIDNNDFRKAFIVKSNSLVEQGRANLQDRPMYLLLKDIVELLDKQEKNVLKR